MDEILQDGELHEVELRLRQLGRGVEIDPCHTARLREDLLKRHHELRVERNQRSAFGIWTRFRRLRRLTLIAAPALATAIAFSVVLGVLQISGHQSTRTAEAQITSAFARTAPYIHGWTFTIRRQIGSRSEVLLYRASLGPHEILAYYWGHPYLYLHHTWYQVTWPAPQLGGTMTAGNWRLAFAVFPSLLREPHVSGPTSEPIAGRQTEAFAYSVTQPGEKRVMVTAWVDRKSGLVLRMDRILRQGVRVLESDSVDYRYDVRSK